MFSIGENVFAIEGGCIYHAKVLEFQVDETNSAWCKVHYDEWPYDYDEFLTTGRLLKLNAETSRIKLNMDGGCFTKPNKGVHFNSFTDTIGQYKKGDKVIVYTHGLLYMGKVVKLRKHKAIWKYRIRYLNWTKHWDEWVTAEEVFECSPTVEQVQQKLLEYSNVVPFPKCSNSKKCKQVQNKVNGRIEAEQKNQDVETVHHVTGQNEEDNGSQSNIMGVNLLL